MDFWEKRSSIIETMTAADPENWILRQRAAEKADRILAMSMPLETYALYVRAL